MYLGLKVLWCIKQGVLAIIFPILSHIIRRSRCKKENPVSKILFKSQKSRFFRIKKIPFKHLSWSFGWLVLGLTTLWDSISVYIPKRGRKKKERIVESKNVQTTPTRTYCRRSRPLPYCNPNCRTPRHWKFYPAPSHHSTTPLSWSKWFNIYTVGVDMGIPAYSIFSKIIQYHKNGWNLKNSYVCILSNLHFDKTNNWIARAASFCMKVPSNLSAFSYKTSFCSYARPAQSGPNRTRLCGPCIAAITGDQLCFGPIRSLSLFRSFSVNVLPSWLPNADQW